MVCRHSPGDPNCGSYSSHVASAERLLAEDRARRGGESPDASNYTVEQAERIGKNLVLKVRYPNCAQCAFEGEKVLVFVNVNEMDALKWRKIDPHFRNTKPAPREAPSPAARFPPTAEGWADAVAYANGKF